MRVETRSPRIETFRVFPSRRTIRPFASFTKEMGMRAGKRSNRLVAGIPTTPFAPRSRDL